jgi:hypothetical protein
MHSAQADLTAKAAGEHRLPERAKLVQNTDCIYAMACLVLLSPDMCIPWPQNVYDCEIASFNATKLEDIPGDKSEMRNPNCLAHVL